MRITQIVSLILLSGMAAVGLYIAALSEDASVQYVGVGVAVMFGGLVAGAGIAWAMRKARRIGKVEDLSATIALRRSNGAALVVVVILAAFLMGVLLVGQSDIMSAVELWVLVSLLVIAILFSLLAFRDARLQLSPDGLDYSVFRCGPIDWSDVADAKICAHDKIGLVILEMRHPQKYLARGLRKDPAYIFDRMITRSRFLISARTFGLEAATLADAISVRARAFGGPAKADLDQIHQLRDTLA